MLLLWWWWWWWWWLLFLTGLFTASLSVCASLCVCMCVCVCVRERERERENNTRILRTTHILSIRYTTYSQDDIRTLRTTHVLSGRHTYSHPYPQDGTRTLKTTYVLSGRHTYSQDDTRTLRTTHEREQTKRLINKYNFRVSAPTPLLTPLGPRPPTKEKIKVNVRSSPMDAGMACIFCFAEGIWLRAV